MLRLIVTGFVVALSNPTTALIQEYVPPADLHQRGERVRYLVEHAFQMSDHDGDGRLTLAEWHSKEWLVYGDFDHDRDGRLDAAEFDDMRCGGLGEDVASQPPQRSWCLSSAARDFRRLSGRQNGVSAGTLAGQARRGFRFNDANRDGFVTREEQVRTMQQRR